MTMAPTSEQIARASKAAKLLLRAFRMVCETTYKSEGYSSPEAMADDYLRAAEIAALAENGECSR